MPTPTPPVRRRHLMDPANPRKPQPRGNGMPITQVQKWVMSVLLTTTVFHLAAGIVVAAYFLADHRTGAQIGLLVIAGMFGMIAMAIGFIIHQRKLPNLWLLLGWVPSVVGAFLIFP